MEFTKTIISGRGYQSWTTPRELFDHFDALFNFEIDLCASPENALCKEFFTEADDALTKSWEGKTCFLNPPFGLTKKFVEAACEETAKGATVVMIIPANLNTNYWHDYLLDNDRVELIFPRGGIKFGGAKKRCPIPVAIVIWHPPVPTFAKANDSKEGGN
jgi:phage N-6-adenine-methyltransferase